jgi:hypothetical protein
MNFDKICDKVLEEKVKKPKPMSGYDYYKSVRKSVPKPGTSFKDKSKYNRQDKHKNNVYEESLDAKNYFRQISDALAAFGLKAFEQDPILKIVQKAITLSFNEGYKAGTSNPFRSL